MSLVERICKDSYPIWDKCLNSDFVQEISKGTISDEKVLKYIVEDTIYLIEYAKCFAYLITKCNTLEEIKYYYNILGFVNENETSVRRTFIKSHGLTDYEVETKTPDPVCKEYTDYLVNWCKNGNIKEGLMAILPCMLSYQYIFERILTMYPNVGKTKYADILAYYIMPEYKIKALEWMEYANTICGDVSKEEEKHLTEIFRNSSILEYKFWVMSYE